MNKLVLFIILIISNSSLIGQEVQVSTDKKVYNFGEIIEVTFTINVEHDSLELPEFKGFKLISWPKKGSVTQFQNGEKTVSKTTICNLRPMLNGQLNIESPIYFVDGKKIKGEPVKIKVKAANLTKEELEAKKYQFFIDDEIKPRGAVRIVMYKEKAYLEVFGEGGWQFYRRLTSKEIDHIIQEIKYANDR